MNILHRCLRGGWALLLATAAVAQAEPVIRSIRAKGTNLVVAVAVDPSSRRITLEGRPRLGPGAWLPKATQWPAPQRDEVLFELPMTADLEVLRVRSETDSELPAPARFFNAPARFDAVVTVSSNPPPTATPDLPGIPSDSKFSAGGTEARAVVESDIWQMSGPTVFFFNNVRGLQVIDLAQPDQPVLRGTLPLAAQGEQMYLLPNPNKNEAFLALLASDACQGQLGGVVILRVQDFQPSEVARVPYEGYVRESRLVGSVLYLATQRWAPSSDPALLGAWRAETLVQSILLADPTRPVSRVAAVIPAATDAIQATDQFLLVATSGPASGSEDPSLMPWLRPGIHGVTVFDISDPSGTVVQKGSALVRGRIQDKFKLGLAGDTLSVISLRDAEFKLVTKTNRFLRYVGPNGERLDPPVTEEYAYNDVTRVSPSQTWLETFSLASPETPRALGSLKIVEDESLFASRYVGDRAYVVTFRSIDPLWVIDLSNPLSPAIRGELQIPGYSSYLQPIGSDRLMAVGVENARATVALFDVKDPAKPTQLSKVFLGSGWSWSEANSDEKAFTFLPDLGLALVPWQGTEKDQWIQGLQLVDLAGNQLVKRGLVRHSVPARRATALGQRIVSLSSQELLVVDATDRDQPSLKADLDLAFPAERVRTLADRLDIVGSNPGKAPRLSRVKASTPDIPLGSLALPPFPVVGMERIGASLHLLLFEPDSFRQSSPISPDGTPLPGDTVLVPGQLHLLEVAFVGDQPVQSGSSSIPRPEGYLGGPMKAFVAAPGSVVWMESGGASFPPWVRPGSGGGAFGDGGLMLPGRGGPWWGWRNSMTLVTEDVTSPGQPKLSAALVLGGTEGVSGFSNPHVIDGKVHVSHQEWIVREVEGPKDPSGKPTRLWTTETRHVLHVVDVSHPAEPLRRPPLGLPAQLAGASHNGSVLYTTGSSPTNTPGLAALSALAYDGVTVSPVAEVPVADGSALLVLPNGRVACVEPALHAGDLARLATWSLGPDGQWSRIDAIPLPGSWATLHPLGGLVLAETDRAMAFLRPLDSGWASLGSAPRPCSFWGNWEAGDAGPDAVAWLPRGDSGLVRLAPNPSDGP